MTPMTLHSALGKVKLFNRIVIDVIDGVNDDDEGTLKIIES